MASMVALVRKHADMRRVVAIQLLLGVCYGGFWATIATMLLKVHALGPQIAGLIGIPGAAGILVARPAGRWLERSLERHLARSRRELARRLDRMAAAAGGRVFPLPRPRGIPKPRVDNPPRAR
jgi:hypothetical protein